MSQSTNNLKPSKIIIMGLDNSGKTSILISLSKESNLLSYCTLKPTKGIDIKQFETREILMSCWDFGGQAQYREEYLENFEKYIDKVERIIFVVDIQDINRYDDSLRYFEAIMNKIKSEKNMMLISIFLHKYDPNLSQKEGFGDIDTKINLLLIEKFRELIPEGFKCEIYKTTIYTIFEKTSV